LGYAPRPPIILMNVSVAESRNHAHERAVTYLGGKWDSIDSHCHFSDGHLASVKGYEFYGKMAKTYSEMKDEGYRQAATEFYVKIQVSGTPDDCLQQVAELQRLTGLDHLVTELAFGGMPHEEAELNMRLLRGARQARAPARSRLRAAVERKTPGLPTESRATTEGIFAPA
jgi:hypothetical protein